MKGKHAAHAAVARLIGALALITCAATASAKECTARASCEFYVNEHGDLMRSTTKDSPPTTLFSGADSKATTSSEYVMSRSDRYYLVREYAGSDKHFDIVPLTVNDRNVGFERVLHFALMSTKTAESGREVWVADEIDLAGSHTIETFSWDRVLQSLGKIEPSTDGEAGNALQPGFSAIPLTIHDSTGAVTGQRAYLYADKLGVTPESIVCAARCLTDTSSPPGTLRGGIGPYPITLTLATEQNQIKGSYRYDGKRGTLILDGSVHDGGAISMTEHPDMQSTRSTGKFDAIFNDGMYTGLWTPSSKGTQLPFFAVADSL